MSIEKEIILDTQAKITASDLRESHKDAINDMLRKAAHATNGVDNKQQALTEWAASISICMARDAIYRREDIRALLDEALTKHRQDCPLAKSSDDGGIVISGHGGKATIPQALWGVTVGAVVLIAIIATVWKAKGWA